MTLAPTRLALPALLALLSACATPSRAPDVEAGSKCPQHQPCPACPSCPAPTAGTPTVAPVTPSAPRPPETTAERRVILDAAGRARRVVLRQPPHYRLVGAQDARP